MSLVAIGIILLAAALMLGPVLMLRPSPRTQQVAQLRSRAAALGLGVQLTSLPNHPDTHLVAYCRPWPSYIKNAQKRPWKLIKHNYSHDIHCADHWDWQGEDRPSPAHIQHIKDLLPQLPESILALEATPAGVACYWTEVGGMKTLQHLAHWLDDLVTHCALPSLTPQP